MRIFSSLSAVNIYCFLVSSSLAVAVAAAVVVVRAIAGTMFSPVSIDAVCPSNNRQLFVVDDDDDDIDACDGGIGNAIASPDKSPTIITC